MNTTETPATCPKSSWEIACEWYGYDEIATDLQRIRDEYGDRRIPLDQQSPGYAAWLTNQYRLAMNKGIQLGREESATLTRERDSLAGELVEAVRKERKVCRECKAELIKDAPGFSISEMSAKIQEAEDAVDAVLSRFPAPQPPCQCWSCQPVEVQLTRMILCEFCGNKRCPHATHHDSDCTRSNEPEQPGSRYTSTPVAFATAAPVSQCPRCKGRKFIDGGATAFSVPCPDCQPHPDEVKVTGEELEQNLMEWILRQDYPPTFGAVAAHARKIVEGGVD